MLLLAFDDALLQFTFQRPAFSPLLQLPPTMGRRNEQMPVLLSASLTRALSSRRSCGPAHRYGQPRLYSELA